MTIFALRGEKITRESGEHVCTVARDLDTEMLAQPGLFEDWQITAPVTGELMPIHEPDGSRWVRLHPNGFIDLHFERGWRSETKPPLRPEPRRPFLELD